LPRLLILHLLPGALLTLVYAVGGSLWADHDVPPLLILMLGLAVVVVPFELGVVLRARRQATGTVSLQGAVEWWGPTPAWQLAGILAGTFAWAAVVFTALVGALDGVLLPLFQWVPSWFFLSTEYGRYSRSVLLLTAGLFVLLNGVVGPVVEELYFRGYLLPRLARYGWWAPAINTVLFSLYHFFTPWQNLTRIVALLPMVYAVWARRDIRIGLGATCCSTSAAVRGPSRCCFGRAPGHSAGLSQCSH
jgi:uncharacterized protein